MLVLATILDNPGEQPHQTRYRDPAELRALNYTGLVIYPTTGLSGLLGPDTPGHAEARQAAGELYESVRRTAAEAHAAGLAVYLMFDAPTLSRELVGSAMTCGRQPQTLCPASDALLDMSGQCLEALVSQIDHVDGIVLRLGDSDAHRLPSLDLVGNDIYSPHCPRCSGLTTADRIERFVRFFHELVVGKLGRQLIVRAWNARPGGMHDNVALCQQVVERLPADDKLILSFKFTQTDFWRYQQWNPSSLACGDRPILYELECQREFEAKGAIPNYQLPLWRDGMTEVPEAQGLAQVTGAVNFAGLWAWVRGGGWGGPFVGKSQEAWIDANVVAVPQLAANPQADVAELAMQWVQQRLGVTNGKAAAVLQQLLLDSPQTALETFYIGPYARHRKDAWYPSGQFVEDDVIDAAAAKQIIESLSSPQLEQAVAEKQRAADRLAQQEAAVGRVASKLPQDVAELVEHTGEYADTLARTLRDLVAGLAAERMHQRKPDRVYVETARKSYDAAQRWWVHHTQRVPSLRKAATAFRSDNLWDITQAGLDKFTQL